MATINSTEDNRIWLRQVPSEHIQRNLR